MPAILVHGVPDTYHVWDAVRPHLDRTDVIALALPGFGCPRPESFSATKEDYLAWIISEIEALGEPVDLVGNDWGCMFTARVASVRPDLVRSWVGGNGPITPAFKWHEWPTAWQTPGVGEQWMADLDPQWFSKQLEGAGLTASAARSHVEHIDDQMKSSILRLYRSAVNVGQEWRPGLANISAPTVIFWGTQDGDIQYADDFANAVRATRLVKFDAGHWPQIEHPEQFARLLTEHWSSVPA